MKAETPELRLACGSGRFTIRVEPGVIETMAELSSKARRKETGGILIGRLAEDGRLAIISEATSQPRDSIFSWNSFRRGSSGLKELLAKRWEAGFHYLGEWHFHPGGSPTPSGPDVREMKSISSNPLYGCREPILLIIGGAPPDRYDLSASIYPVGEAPVRLSKCVVGDSQYPIGAVA